MIIAEITGKNYRTMASVGFSLWVMFITCLAGNVMAGSVSTIMPVYLPVITDDLMSGASQAQINNAGSLISAIYIAGWTIGGFSWGIIADRIGRSRSLAMAVILFGIFTLLISFVRSWELLLLFRLLSGFGVGGTLVLTTTLLSEVWPEKSRAIFVGMLSIGFPIGIISSGTINYNIPDWRTGFMMGIIPLSIGIISFWAVKESEKWKALRFQPEKGISLFKVAGNRINLINGSIIFGSMLIGLWAVFSWLPTWIQSLLNDNLSGDERSLGMMLLGMGGLAGGFFSGWVSRALGTRKAMLLCFGGCFITAILLFKGNTEYSILILPEIAILSFLFGISQGLLGYYIPLLFPVSIRATATGFCFNTGRIFTTAAVFFIGWLVTSLGGYGNSLFAFSFIFLAGFIVLYYSKNITT
ncbi:MAG TPA: MFS transporter [Bacteroidales bacterium]|jgi:predicted MFS family arabinose efflux permease|nr:MFS transporter [Bacteroidales bacterium]